MYLYFVIGKKSYCYFVICYFVISLYLFLKVSNWYIFKKTPISSKKIDVRGVFVTSFVHRILWNHSSFFRLFRRTESC